MFKPAPVLTAGSGGGGGGPGLTPVTLTATTDEIDATDAANVDLALPSGIVRCFIIGSTIRRTAGASAMASLALYGYDDRSDANPAMVYGNPFGGADVGANTLYGPYNTTGGNVLRHGIPYRNLDDSEFLRLILSNKDFNEPGTYEVSLTILPIEE